MTPGSILHDPQFLCHDKTQQNKLLVVLNDGAAGRYILVKTTSVSKDKASSTPGCHPKDRFRNFYIPQGQSDFRVDTWIMLNEFYEFDRNELLKRSLSGFMQIKGRLPETLVKSLLVCAKESLDITPAQEASLDETLTMLALNMSIESTRQPPQPESDNPQTGATKPPCPTC